MFLLAVSFNKISKLRWTVIIIDGQLMIEYNFNIKKRRAFQDEKMWDQMEILHVGSSGRSTSVVTKQCATLLGPFSTELQISLPGK